MTRNALNYLYLSAPIAEASDKAELDSATKIRITHYDIDTSLICYATRKLQIVYFHFAYPWVILNFVLSTSAGLLLFGLVVLPTSTELDCGLVSSCLVFTMVVECFNEEKHQRQQCL